MLPRLDRLTVYALGSVPASTSTPAGGPQPRTRKPTPAAVEEQLAKLFGEEREDEEDEQDAARADDAAPRRPSRPSPRGHAGETPGPSGKRASPNIG